MVAIISLLLSVFMLTAPTQDMAHTMDANEPEEIQTHEDTLQEKTYLSGSITVTDAETGEDNENMDGLIYLGQFKCYAYCPCKKCCGKSPGSPSYGITATGTTATHGRTIAVDPRQIPLGSDVYIDGYGWFVAEDTGGGINGNKIDMFYDSHQAAIEHGVKTVSVYVKGG